MIFSQYFNYNYRKIFRKNEVLYLFNLNLQSIIYNTQQIIYLYPEKKLKIKDVCAISGSIKKYLGPDIIYYDYLYLKSHCKKMKNVMKPKKEFFNVVKKYFFKK